MPESVEIVGNEKDVFYYLENLKMKLKQNLFDVFSQEQAGFLAGLLIGDKNEIPDEIKTDFRNSSLSHILAISGMHIIYVSFGFKFLLDLLIQKQKLKNSLMIVFLLFFAIFTGGSPSCLRACIMCSLLFLSKIFYRKYDFYTAILVSFDIILIWNCYYIESIGLWLSFLATFGMVYIKTNKIQKNNKIIESIKASISCNLMIFPILWNKFNTFSLTFFISNIMASIVIGPIIILGYLYFFFGKWLSWLSILEKILIDILFLVAKLIGKIKISQIIVPSLPIIIWIFYYLMLLIIVYFINHSELWKIIKRKLIIYFINHGKILQIIKKKLIIYIVIYLLIIRNTNYLI